MEPESLTLGSRTQDVARYCRELEAYLCQKNFGHLIRIVGPAFGQVCSWAERGVPLKVAFRGIDRYCGRYYANRQRRRPVRIEFCEADILDAFDEWRRAVGVSSVAPSTGTEPLDSEGRRSGLTKHIDRAVARLQTFADRHGDSAALADAVGLLIDELRALGDEARKARGEARMKVIGRLASLDALLLSAAREQVDAELAAELRHEAEQELAPFGRRLSADARKKALEAAFDGLVRDTVGLPVLKYD